LSEKVLAILGPTASGKSALSLAVAEWLNGEIINCDSTAVYRGFDIGTDKLPVEERRGIPHHLIDIADPTDVYTAARFAEDADLPVIRARMIQLAASLGWLSQAEMHAELMRMIGELIVRDAVGASEVDLICELNKDHMLDGERNRLPVSPAAASCVSTAAVQACLGSADSRARVLQAVTNGVDADTRIADVFLRHRPIYDVGELRDVASGIARMPGSSAQVRALDTLAQQRLKDRETLAELARLFPVAQTADVQRAIAGVLIRSDYQLLPKPEMVSMLSQYRLKSNGGNDVIDILLRRLQAQ